MLFFEPSKYIDIYATEKNSDNDDEVYEMYHQDNDEVERFSR